MPDSIRWRLPASYGAIALLAVTLLGGILLLALRGYYAGQERRFLTSNARAVEVIVGPAMEVFAGPVRDPGLATGSPDVSSLLKSQIDVLSFLTQTHIQLYDRQDQLLADSGMPQDYQAVATLSLQLQLADARQAISQTLDLNQLAQDYSTLLVIEEDGTRLQSETTVRGGPSDVDGIGAPLSLLETPGDFVYSTPGGETLRSNRRLRQPILGPGGGRLGTVELSQGPAFGRAMLTNVFWGWLVAAAVAAFMATIVGWVISGRLSRPVVALAEATEKMAGGDLTVRAHVSRNDELGRLARSFNSMAERVETTVATLRHFVADAAHEINTPLTALRTNLDLARQTSPEDPAIGEAQAQAQRIEKLSDDLLDLSRLEAGIGQRDFQNLDLAGLATEWSESYAAQAEQAGIDFAIDAPELPIWVHGNEVYLQRGIDNLIDNAIKFTPAGGRVTLAVTADGEWVTLVVTDTGMGIAEGERKLIFNRFHRAREAAGFPGSGLGLAIVKSVAETHQGKVSFESNNRGSTFIFRLPQVDPSPAR